MVQLNTRGFDEPAEFTWGRFPLHGLEKARFAFTRNVCIRLPHPSVHVECFLCFSFTPNVINSANISSQLIKLKLPI